MMRRISSDYAGRRSTVEFVLDLPNDLDSLQGDKLMQHRRIRMQLDAAQSVIADSIKVDDAGLRHQQQQDWLEGFNKKLAAAEAKLLAQNR